jgi:hypothetical protein
MPTPILTAGRRGPHTWPVRPAGRRGPHERLGVLFDDGVFRWVVTIVVVVASVAATVKELGVAPVHGATPRVKFSPPPALVDRDIASVPLGATLALALQDPASWSSPRPGPAHHVVVWGVLFWTRQWRCYCIQRLARPNIEWARARSSMLWAAGVASERSWWRRRPQPSPASTVVQREAGGIDGGVADHSRNLCNTGA